MPTKKSPSTAKTTAPKKGPSAKTKISDKPKATGRKKRPAGKNTSKLAPSLTLVAKSKVTEPVITHGEISLRAYFIAERRRKMGWKGDSHSDWLEALSQLRAEALEKPLKKR